jgi:hypothetical protein
MESWMGPYAADYSTLGFAVENHREAFRAFADLQMDPRSVAAALTARESLLRQFPAATLQICCAPELMAQEADEQSGRCLGFVTLHSSNDPAEVGLVAADLRRYFGRHFPGRFRHPAAGVASEPADARHVYAAFFARGEE